ncbi:MAG: hypothetical protein J1E33_06310 [Alistipes sp.]|nr:hypothetical protein [Alistipes sp.]
MNTTQHTTHPTKRAPFVFVDPYHPDMLLIPSRTFDTTPVVNRDDIEEAEIIEETAENSAILTLGEQAMRIIFELLRKEIEWNTRSDNEYEIEWGQYIIGARHHYESHGARGGDHYCGQWEEYEVVDRDDIEIIFAYNVIDDIEDTAAVKKLNNFYKNVKLNNNYNHEND